MLGDPGGERSYVHDVLFDSFPSLLPVLGCPNSEPIFLLLPSATPPISALPRDSEVFADALGRVGVRQLSEINLILLVRLIETLGELPKRCRTPASRPKRINRAFAFGGLGAGGWCRFQLLGALLLGRFFRGAR